ncbi:acyl-CoA carboxylase subunit epsilon [Mycetocola tolaasinivorans]|uniref:Acyl-CoA carboxylase subunit epsilon n=1 Tax=Mycetocola tolaasinivorans TaxID=76635 RepID=A0A3L7A830_9MICO|nr:acyl-CoA carboxylase subunit epsilon [Mycetocola tolaasinivorans]RLP75970.1 acyl-CoA carboxylase subunit epsilon [Mycetocola tolaasinivorans]
MSDAGLPAPDLRFTRGTPTEEEIAAVSAVLTLALAEEGARAERQENTSVSAWTRSQRAVRAPLHPGAGRWRGFTG